MEDEYKVRCENEYGQAWTVWTKALSPEEAEEINLEDPRVCGCFVVGIKDRKET
jgi:hypothetical protein